MVQKIGKKTNVLASIFLTQFYKKLGSGIIKNNTCFDDIFDIISGIAG